MNLKAKQKTNRFYLSLFRYVSKCSSRLYSSLVCFVHLYLYPCVQNARMKMLREIELLLRTTTATDTQYSFDYHIAAQRTMYLLYLCEQRERETHSTHNVQSIKHKVSVRPFSFGNHFHCLCMCLFPDVCSLPYTNCMRHSFVCCVDY